MWLEIADEDFKNLKAMGEARSIRAAVLFAQKAVKKILKAYICEYTDIKVKRIHFLEILVEDFSELYQNIIMS